METIKQNMEPLKYGGIIGTINHFFAVNNVILQITY
jgi:hypothetical protein